MRLLKNGEFFEDAWLALDDDGNPCRRTPTSSSAQSA